MRTEQEIKDRKLYLLECMVQCANEHKGWIEPGMKLEAETLDWVLGVDNLSEQDTNDTCPDEVRTNL